MTHRALQPDPVGVEEDVGLRRVLHRGRLALALEVEALVGDEEIAPAELLGALRGERVRARGEGLVRRAPLERQAFVAARRRPVEYVDLRRVVRVLARLE